MKISELFESSNSHVSFCFGRMNPPTLGHKKLVDAVASQGGDYFIFPSRPTPKTKQQRLANPLDVETKIHFIKSIFSSEASHIVDDPRLNTFLSVCTYLYGMGYNHVTIVAGSDRLDDLKSLCNEFNGVEGKSHGYYKFDTVDGKSSGSRDPDSEGLDGTSGTKAREAAVNGDFDKFQSITGAGTYTKELYDAVRKGLGVKETVEEGYGRYWCSTDKKWKTRKGPKQTRKSK